MLPADSSRINDVSTGPVGESGSVNPARNEACPRTRDRPSGPGGSLDLSGSPHRSGWVWRLQYPHLGQNTDGDQDKEESQADRATLFLEFKRKRQNRGTADGEEEHQAPDRPSQTAQHAEGGGRRHGGPIQDAEVAADKFEQGRNGKTPGQESRQGETGYMSGPAENAGHTPPYHTILPCEP